MRNRLALPVLFLAANCAFAETPKPNTLTAKEIADGWILLFDGETTFGWKVDGDVKIDNGELRLGGVKKSMARTAAMFGGFTLRFDSRYEGDRMFDIHLLDHDHNLGRLPSLTWQTVEYKIDTDGTATSITADLLPQRTGGGGVVRRLMPTDFGFSIQAGGKLAIRNVRLKPNDLKPLFNGKDLTGWKQYSGDPNRMKSKFSVTNEGWLNVQDGSGDLQTESQYADFVFQGECISNGKHLNSGLFFRCLPGQYLQGYEMQIRNEWKGDDRTKPVDFGTGSIYRRQPARKVVSTDGKWFTMTIAAHGRHIATWVDGYQVCDWTDPRPEKDNAREGAKLGKGHFSIQGHDPTTNLSFRNLRVAELK